jgi:hypothetical protein
MTVEHVHVHPGGQAIVGNVAHAGTGAGQNVQTINNPPRTRLTRPHVAMPRASALASVARHPPWGPGKFAAIMVPGACAKRNRTRQLQAWRAAPTDISEPGCDRPP